MYDGSDDIRVFWVRHGQTRSNAERRFLGRTDEPLDHVGREQVAALAQAPPWAQVDAVLCSPLLRARQTAEGLGLTSVSVAALQEVDQGALEGLSITEAVTRFPDFFAAWREDPGHGPIPGGEGFPEGRDRALRAVEAQLAGMAAGSTVVVVSHLMIMASVRCHLAGEPIKRWADFRVSNAGVVELHWSANRGWVTLV